ncbi:MAG: hypothetical protein P8I38_05000 [Arenicella sp.]|jgi:hypothetical protein|nr:hypothetical protein [Arenicella sp.]
MKIVKSTLGVIVLGAAVMFLAGPTHARGSVYIDVPGFSLGVYDRHHNSHRYSKKYRHDDRYSNRYYDHDNYRDHDRGYNRNYSKKHRNKHGKHYSNNRNNSGRYNQYGYQDQYNYGSGYQRNNRQTYTICPDPGFSRYRIERGRCYQHKDHFHCE